MKATIKLTDSLWEQLRIQALKEKRSASAILDELIAEYLKKTLIEKGGQ